MLETYVSWAYLGYKDIVMRYRRTVLGPFWMVLAISITITCMAFVSSFLFNSSIYDSLPYVSSGMITWLFLSSLVSESSCIFISQSSLLKNVNVQFSSFILRSFVRMLIVYLHNLLFYILVYFYCKGSLTFYHLLFPVWVVVFFINFIALSCSLGILSTRFRDVSQLVVSIVSVSAFLTPIIWRKEALGDNAIYISLNPFIAFMDVMRNSLMGEVPSMIDIKIVSCITLLNIIIAIFSLKKYKRRVMFWL